MGWLAAAVAQMAGVATKPTTGVAVAEASTRTWAIAAKRLAIAANADRSPTAAATSSSVAAVRLPKLAVAVAYRATAASPKSQRFHVNPRPAPIWGLAAVSRRTAAV